MIDTDRAWLAGIIDGEGHIAITKIKPPHQRRRNPSYQVLVRVAMTHLLTMQRVQELMGGNLRTRKGRQAQHNDCYECNRADNNAIVVLQSILPYLITKRAQALLAIDFRNTPVGQGEDFFLRMKVLNQRGK